MIRHVSVLTWNEDASAEAIEAVRAGLAGLPSVIPELTEYRYGDDAGITDGNGSFGIVADFPTVEAFLAYRDHPVHQEVIRDRIRPILAHRSAVQYEIEPLG
jgi:Stress responsive A/B Barrel Domain